MFAQLPAQAGINTASTRFGANVGKLPTYRFLADFHSTSPFRQLGTAQWPVGCLESMLLPMINKIKEERKEEWKTLAFVPQVRVLLMICSKQSYAGYIEKPFHSANTSGVGNGCRRSDRMAVAVSSFVHYPHGRLQQRPVRNDNPGIVQVCGPFAVPARHNEPAQVCWRLAMGKANPGGPMAVERSRSGRR